MKKSLIQSTIVLTVLAFISVSSLQAQGLGTSPVTFGIKGGLNFANYNDISGGDLNSRTGFLIGGFLNFDLPALPITLQPEVLYSQKGAEDSGVELNVDYLEIPVIAKVGVVPTGPVKLNLQVGPYVGFVLNSEASGGGISVDIDNAQTDFGGEAGAGADISLGVTTLTIDARYGFAFNDAFEDGQGKNGVFSIAAGIVF